MKHTRHGIFTLTVRRGAICACAILCLLLAGGCRLSQRDILWYQDGFASLSLEEGDRLWCLTREADGFRASVSSPALPTPLFFTLTEAGSFLEAEGVRIPVTDAMTAGMRRICSLLSLRTEDLESVERAAGKTAAEDGVCVVARCKTETGTVQIYIGEDSLPLYFELTDDQGVTRFRLAEYIPSQNGSAER